MDKICLAFLACVNQECDFKSTRRTFLWLNVLPIWWTLPGLLGSGLTQGLGLIVDWGESIRAVSDCRALS